MGEVFRARRVDAGPDQPEVALKLIRGEHAADPHLRDLFLREARIGALLHHPNVVELREVGEVQGIPFLAMEYVDGVSLDRLVGRPLSLAAAVRVGLSITAALEYIHQLAVDGRPQHLVHRDVSPANVLVGRDGGVKLGDFGIAKLAGASLTRTHEVKGKRGYMAPEQAAGGPVDNRADLFSLGAVLHRIAYQAPLFRDVEEWLAAGAPPPVGGELSHGDRPGDRAGSGGAFPERGRAGGSLARPVRAGTGGDRRSWARGRRRGMNEGAGLGELDQVILAELASEIGDTARVEPPAVGPPAAVAEALDRGCRGCGRGGGCHCTGHRLAARGAGARGGGSILDRRCARGMHRQPTPAARPPRRRCVAPARRREEFGFLTLDTQPWATVYLAGRKIGTTPFHRVKLPAGRHRLTLDVESSGRRRALTVAIRPGAELQAQRGSPLRLSAATTGRPPRPPLCRPPRRARPRPARAGGSRPGRPRCSRARSSPRGGRTPCWRRRRRRPRRRTERRRRRPPR